MSVRRVRVVVTGRVQGVFFRGTCARHARGLELSGWVRNRRDGAVEAAFEGADPAVESMVAWCREGPDLAVVDTVEVVEEPPAGEARFSIL